MWILCPSLELGTKYLWRELQRQCLELSQKEGPSRDCPTQGSTQKTTTKPRHYCRCQQELADRRLTRLSPERFYQCLSNTEMDAHSHLLEYRVPNEGARESTQGAEGVCSPLGGTTI